MCLSLNKSFSWTFQFPTPAGKYISSESLKKEAHQEKVEGVVINLLAFTNVKKSLIKLFDIISQL